MIFRSWTFALAHAGTGQLVGVAVVCPAVHYMTTQLNGSSCRHYVPTAQWRAFERELRNVIEGTPLPANSVLSGFLFVRTRVGVLVRCEAVRDITIDDGADAGTLLDSALSERS